MKLTAIGLAYSTTFSDSIVTSASSDTAGLTLLTVQTNVLCFRLLTLGILTRGGLARGKLFHDPSIVLGKGLISAYQLESKSAKYPRVVLAPEIIHEVERLPTHAHYDSLIRQDSDGEHSLNYLQPKIAEFLVAEIPSSFGPPQWSCLLDQPFRQARWHILKLLEADLDHRVCEKAKWLANYFNSAVLIYPQLRVPAIPADP